MPNKTDIITSNLDEEREGPGSPWEITALGKLHKSIVATDVEGKIDNYFIFKGGWGKPLLLRIPSPSLE